MVKAVEKATVNQDVRKFVESVENTRLGTGAWSDSLAMDRFVILVFLTSAEKRAFTKAQFGTENVIDYFDGDDVERIALKKR